MKIKDYLVTLGVTLVIFAVCGFFQAVGEQNWHGDSDYVLTLTNGAYQPLSSNSLSTNYRCDEVTVYNTNTVSIQIQRTSNTNMFYTIPASSWQPFKVEATVNELGVKPQGSTNIIYVPFEVVRYFKRGG